MAKYLKRHFEKNDIQKDSSTGCTTPLIIRQVQIKTYAPSRTAEVVKVGTANATCWARTCGDENPCPLFFGTSNAKTTWGKGLAVYYKNKLTLNYDLVILLGIFPSLDAQEGLYENVHQQPTDCIIHNSPRL